MRSSLKGFSVVFAKPDNEWDLLVRSDAGAWKELATPNTTNCCRQVWGSPGGHLVAKITDVNRDVRAGYDCDQSWDEYKFWQLIKPNITLRKMFVPTIAHWSKGKFSVSFQPRIAQAPAEVTGQVTDLLWHVKDSFAFNESTRFSLDLVDRQVGRTSSGKLRLFDYGQLLTNLSIYDTLVLNPQQGGT